MSTDKNNEFDYFNDAPAKQMPSPEDQEAIEQKSISEICYVPFAAVVDALTAHGHIPKNIDTFNFLVSWDTGEFNIRIERDPESFIEEIPNSLVAVAAGTGEFENNKREVGRFFKKVDALAESAKYNSDIVFAFAKFFSDCISNGDIDAYNRIKNFMKISKSVTERNSDGERETKTVYILPTLSSGEFEFSVSSALVERS